MDGTTGTEKLPNPREDANPLSTATFAYTVPTFIKGYKRDLQLTDLHETLTEHKSKALTDKIEKAWQEEEIRASKMQKMPSLGRVLLKTFGGKFMLYGFTLAMSETSRIAQPLVLGGLIDYYTPNQTKVTEKEAYLYAMGVILCSLFTVAVMHPTMMAIVHLGMKTRIACCSLIYRKALRLSKTALGDTTVGQVVNLLSNDVNRFDNAALFVHYLWLGPLETFVVGYLTYRELGVSAIIGVACLLLFIPIQMWMGRITSVLRLKVALRTDERVRLMNEIISGIQVIKMYAWEKPFASLVASTRKYEIMWITASSYVRGILMSSIMITTRISIFACLTAYVLFGYDITARQVFVLTSFYNVLRHTMTAVFPQGVTQLSEVLVSVARLNQFMLREERAEKPQKTAGGSPGVRLEGATAKWSESSTEKTLTSVSFGVKPGQLLAVIGPVGSGKSSLFQAILGELPLEEGTVEINGEISYASQEPWLFASSIRQNILFGLPMDADRYKKVIKVCSLERDFSLLPYGDRTIVGERGVSLSGGQRARVNLARAVYKNADIYLLDDPLSAVDTHVGKELFENCITGFLKNKTCILITHQLQYLKDVDHIIILEDGKVTAEGNYRELQKSGLDFAKMLDKHEETEEKQRKDSVAVASRQNSVSEEVVEKAPKEVEEQKSKGSVGGFVYRAYFGAGGNCCLITTMFGFFLVTQFFASGVDYFTSFWTNLEQQRSESNPTTITSSILYNALRALIDNYVDLSSETCIYIYAALTGGLLCFTLVRSFIFFTVCMRSSTRLHNRMFVSITRASMRFFNTNTSGRILNRFSKDIGTVDEMLPSAMIDSLQIGLVLVGIVVIVGVVNPWLLLPTGVIGVLFYLMRNFYLATSRNVKRLEGVTRSPVFAHLNASLQGLTTIRAFRAETILQEEFDNHQDLHSSAFFCFLATSRAFGYWLDLICIIYIAVVTLSFLLIGNERFGGNVGLAITQSIGLTGMFQWGLRQSTEVENQMTSVERVLEYTNVESERQLDTPDDKKPPPTWPQHGKIVFRNLCLSYDPYESPVLKGLNFTVNPKEKIGIVGRTGAGKSSLIAALFQLAYTEGSILIDDVDITELGLHDLRSKISIIPQEPFLFSGTLRRNLDPFDEYTDNVLWKALEEVELKEAVNDFKSGLEYKVSEGGSNFSVGQRQLVCLARAIIRNNKVLVLDEATANVDPQTDALIQTTIRKKFADCTVLTIAHRLHTVMDSDKVLVMDAGRLVEFDHPSVLLQDDAGVLFGMVQKTGKAMADGLIAIAKEHYKEMRTVEATQQDK